MTNVDSDRHDRSVFYKIKVKKIQKNNTLVWCTNADVSYNKKDYEMGEYDMAKKKRRKKTFKRSIKKISCIILGIVLIGLLVLLTILVKGEKSREKLETEKKAEEKVEQGLAFPYKLDNDQLEIESVFQYSGMNPDCNEEEGEDIGAIQLKNCSDKYLESAELTVTTTEGQEYTFIVENLPAGSSVMAFEVANKELPTLVNVTQIDANTSYSDQASLHEDAVSVATDELGITLNNISAEAIQNMTVIYHCVLDDIYFGGKSYQKQVESLGVGESTIISADECYIGEAAVVEIKY